MIERIDPSSVTITIYHACPSGASGSALGPYDLVSYWWVDGSRIRLVGATEAARVAIERAVTDCFGGSLADQVREAQDAAAEAVV